MPKMFIEACRVVVLLFMFIATVLFSIVHLVFNSLSNENISFEIFQKLNYILVIPFSFLLFAIMLSLVALLWHIIDIPTKKQP